MAEESAAATPVAAAPSAPSISQRMFEIETAAYLKQYEKLFNAKLDLEMEAQRLQSEAAPKKEIEAVQQKQVRLGDQLDQVKVYLRDLDERIKAEGRIKKEPVATK